MNIFHKVALQGLKKNRTRTLVTIVGVVLSAAMITAVAAFGTSLLHFMVSASIAKSGDWHVAFPDADAAFVQARVRDEAVSSAVALENIGYAVLAGGQSPENPYLFIAGFGQEAFDALPISLISGRLPANSREVLVPSHVAVKGGVRLSVGQSLTLAVGSRRAGEETLNQHDPYRAGEEALVPAGEKTYTVVGTYERPGFEEHSAPGYTLITKADPAAPADHCTLFVTLRNPRGAQAYASAASGGGAYVLNEEVLRFMGASDNQLFNAMLYAVGGILIAIIMLGSVFLIYNSFQISLNERTHQFGILMSVGASEKQLRNSVLFEGLCIGAIGIPVGILTGIGGVGLILPVVANHFSTVTGSATSLTLWLSIPALLAAAAVSLVTILISACIPAGKAANTPVMECILQTNEIKTEAKAVQTGKLTQRLFGLEGTLARKNFKRNKKRYRSVVLSLTLSVVLFVAGSGFGTTLKQLANTYAVQMDGDVALYTQNLGEQPFFRIYDRVKTAGGVYRTAYQANLTYPCRTSDFPSDFVKAYRASAGGGGTGETLELPLNVQFIEDELYYDFIKSLDLPDMDDTGQGAKVLMVGVNMVRHTTYFTGSTMEFTIGSASGEQTRTLRAAFVDTYPLDPLPRDTTAPEPAYLFMAVIPWSMKPQFDLLGGAAKLGLTVWSQDPAQSAAQIQSILEETGAASDCTLLNLSTAVDLFRSANFVVQVFTCVFVIMISLIAVANVFNTISTNIKLRRRELAMLRSVGMSDRAFNRMMKFECAFYGMRTLLLGLPLAGIVSWLIFKGMTAAERIDDFQFVFPWGSMTVSVLGVFLIVFITMLYAAGKIRKENIIDALRDDMT